MSCWPLAATLAPLAAPLAALSGAAPAARPAEPEEEEPAANAPPAEGARFTAGAEAEATAGAASEIPDDDALPEQPAAVAPTMRVSEDTAATPSRRWREKRARLVRMPLGRGRRAG